MALSTYQKRTLEAMKPGEHRAFADHVMRRDARLETVQHEPRLRTLPKFGDGTHVFFENDDTDEPAIVAVPLTKYEPEDA